MLKLPSFCTLRSPLCHIAVGGARQKQMSSEIEAMISKSRLAAKHPFHITLLSDRPFTVARHRILSWSLRQPLWLQNFLPFSLQDSTCFFKFTSHHYTNKMSNSDTTSALDGVSQIFHSLWTVFFLRQELFCEKALNHWLIRTLFQPWEPKTALWLRPYW